MTLSFHFFLLQDAEHCTETISDFVASDTNSELIKQMATKLDQKSIRSVNGNWKNLGQQFQISGEKLNEIECGQVNPTLALMEYLYSKQEDLTVGKFYEEVKKLKRNDVLKKLDPLLAGEFDYNTLIALKKLCTVGEKCAMKARTIQRHKI